MEDCVQNLTDLPKWSLWVFKIEIEMNRKMSKYNRKMKINCWRALSEKKAKD